MGALKEFDLTGKAAIVIGGGRGIGKGIAITLAEAGADVLAVARTESEVMQTAEEVERLGVKGMGIRADATNPQDVDLVVEAAISQWGRIDILVNSAGGATVRKPLVPLPEESPNWGERVEGFQHYHHRGGMAEHDGLQSTLHLLGDARSWAPHDPAEEREGRQYNLHDRRKRLPLPRAVLHH